jgi:hypothetical protein
MRVRDNRHRIMARLAHNNKIHWYVTPFIIKAEMAAKTRQRIREIVDATFPELKGVYVKY